MIEFIEASHTYLVGGVITPSVSEILKVKFSNDYNNIPRYILDEKANFGTRVHYLIENEITEDSNIYVQNCLNQWQKLREIKNIKVIEKEQIIASKLGYCGTFDAIALIDNKLSIIDYKTTAKDYPDKWSWQLSLYAKAYEEMYKKKIEKLYIVWLEKKSLGKLIEVERKSDSEIREIVDEYKKVYGDFKTDKKCSF